MADWKKSAKQIVDNNKTSSPATQNNTPGANNSSGGWKSSAKQILDNVDFVAPEKRMYELKSDTKSFGTVSYGAYKAVTENKLHTYTPKNEAEKKILDEVKSYIGWKAPEDNTPLIISDYVPGAYNMTKNEYLRHQQSNPDMPEFGSYDYFKNREEKLRPILDEIANDADRTDDTYRAWAENYGKDNNWAAGKPVQKLAKELYEKFKYQDAILAEYKDVDAQLKKFDKKGVHYDSSLEIGTKSGAAEAKYAKERLDAIVNATTFTNDEMVMGVYGELPKEKQKEYDNVRVVAGQRNVEAEKEDAYDYYAKNKDNVYKDNLWGRITGNYKVGRIGIKANDAGFTSYKASTDDIEAVEVYQSLSARIQNHNNATFQNDNAVEEITAIVAQYAPQGVDQAVNKATGSVLGAAVGWASGAGVGTGARLGGSAAVANYMYKQTAGAAFVRLLQESDLSVEDAKILANSEALASGAVEFGLDYVTSGLWKGVGSVTKETTSELGEKTLKALMSKGISEKGAKTIINVSKNAGKLTLDALGEGAEEWIQEGMSITADNYAAEGKAASAFEIFTKAFDLTQYSKEDFSRMNQSFLAGTIIGYGHGGLNAATSFGINKAVSAAASAVDAKVLGEEINKSGETQIVTDAVEMAKENTSPEVVKAVETVETAIAEDNTPPAEAVGTVVKSVLTDEAVQETTAETEQVKNEIEDTSTPASVSVGDTFKDTKTGNTITVVERDAENTTVEIDTGAKTETREFSNTRAENLVTSEQFEQIENAEISETDISADAVDKIIASMTAEEKERHIGWIEVKLSNGERNIDAEELAVYKALVAERKNATPKNITLTRMGAFYEAYGDEAVELANKLNLTLTPKTINGEKVQMVGFPVSSLENYKNILGKGYNVSISDTPSVTSINEQNMPVSTENTPVNEDVTNIDVDMAEGEILSLKHTKNVYSLFKGAVRVVVGKDVISDGFVAIPLTDEALAEVKKVAGDVIQENPNFELSKFYHKDNDVLIQGNPKIDEISAKKKVEKAYVFKIGDAFYTCQQKFIDAFNDGKNIITASKRVTVPWTVHNENGEFVALFLGSGHAMNDERFNSLQSVAEIKTADKQKKAENANKPFNQNEVRQLFDGGTPFFSTVHGINYVGKGHIFAACDENAAEFIKNEYRKQNTNSNYEVEYKDGFGGMVEKMLSTAKELAEAKDPISYIGASPNNRAGNAYVVGDYAIVFNKNYANLIKRRSKYMKIISNGSMRSTILAGYDADGNITGFALPILAKGEVTTKDGKTVPFVMETDIKRLVKEAAANETKSDKSVIEIPESVTEPTESVIKNADSVTEMPESVETASDNVSEEKTSSKKTNELFKKLTDSIPLLKNDAIAYAATGKEFEAGEKKLSQQVYEYFESLGGVVHRENFGDVAINDKGVDSSIAHGMGRAKAIAFASVPAVIEKGRQIDFVENWKGRNYDSYVFAAPIQIGTQRAFVGVVVTKSDTDNRYYLHEVSDNEGNIIIIKKDDASFKSKSEATNDSSSLGETSPTNSIAQDNEIVNSAENNNTETATKLTDKCELIATKHTATGSDIWVVTLKDRLSSEEYKDLSGKVKAVGGYYSRFAKTPDGKAIPGFVFKTEPTAKELDVFNDFFGYTEETAPADTQTVDVSEKVYELVKKARNAEPVDTKSLEEIRDTYGYDLYKDALDKINAENQADELIGKAKELKTLLAEDNVSDDVLNNQPESDTMVSEKTKEDFKVGDILEFDGEQWKCVNIDSMMIDFENVNKNAFQPKLSVILPYELFKEKTDYTVIKESAKNVESQSEILDKESEPDGGRLHAGASKPDVETGIEETGDTPRDRSGKGLSESVGADRNKPDVRNDSERVHGTDDAANAPSESTGNSAEITDNEPETIETQVKTIEKKRPSNKGNFVITDDIATEFDNTPPSAKDNIEAIELLLTLENEGRTATAEEKKTLAKYKGWGGIDPRYIPYELSSRFGKLFDWEQRKAMQSSQNNAFFTPTKVIDAMYAGLKRMGFKGGNVLETSMGVGNFFGRMPSAMSAKSALTGVELESYTARIAQYLYPGATVINKPFQDVAIKNGSYDLVIGNVPFGQNKISYNKKKYSLHNYFIVSSLDKVRDGGVVAVITSAGTLDSHSIDARKAIMDRADVIACYKLPEKVFSRNASTDVQSDLLILRKRASDEKPKGNSILNTITTSQGFRINEYFDKHPENILGALAKGTNAWGEITTVLNDGSFYDKLNAAMKKLPKDLISGKVDLKPIETIVSLSDKPRFFEKNGKVYADDGAGTAAEVSRNQANTVRDYIAVRDAYKELLNAYENGETVINENGTATIREMSDEDIKPLRAALSKAYDNFYKKHGAITGDGKKKIGTKKSTNNTFLEADADYYLVGGLERYDAKNSTFIKSALFEKDTLRKKKVTSVDAASDALAVSLNESGRIDFARMQELTGKTEKQLAEELKGEIVPTPEGDYVLTDIYLSGNIYEKLEAVRGKPEFKEQQEMLEKVIPTPKGASDITVKLGANYISSEYVEQFAREVLNSNLTIRKDITGRWVIEGVKQSRHGDIVNVKYGCDAFNAVRLLEKILNDGEITATKKVGTGDKAVTVLDAEMTDIARQKADDIRAAFETWIFANSERRTEIVDNYNRTYNNYRPLDYEHIAEKLSFDSMDETLKAKLYPHQKKGIARFLFGGNILFAHGVGTGKTFEMIASVMEAKRMGIINKAAMVVPNNKVVDFKNDIAQAYPNAKVLVIDTANKKRQTMLGLVNSNDWDIVLIARTTFTKIPVSPELQTHYIAQQLEDLELQIAEAESDKSVSKRQLKGMITQRDNLEQKIKDLDSDTKRDENSVDFEKLGIDCICVDEAHNYKSIMTPTKLDIKGLVNRNNAQMANDMLMKLDYLRSIDGKIIFGTGTPITNTVSEIYNMMRMVRPDILEDAGIHSLDEWVNTFAKIDTVTEIGIDNQIKNKSTQVTRSFINVSEMIGMFRQFADIVFTTDVVKNLPKAVYKDIELAGTDEHKQIEKQISEVIAKTKKADLLKVYGQLMSMADAASVDLRMLSGAESEHNIFKDYSLDELEYSDSKINTMCDIVYEEYTASNDIKGTQIIFCDKGSGSGTVYSFNLHKDIMQKLIDRGIPEEQIVIIKNQSDAQLEALYDKVNAGEVRVLIGTSQKMAEGLNVQKRVVAIQHPTVTYKPSDKEQGDARGVRAGNINDEVHIYRYLQKNTFDSHKWQAQDRKGEMINKALRGEVVAEMEDIGADEDSGAGVDAATAMAITSGNPLVKEKIDIDKEVVRLKTLQRNYLSEFYRYQDAISKNPDMIRRLTNYADNIEQDIVLRNKYSEKTSIIIKGKTFEKQTDANKALSEAVKTAPKNGQYTKLGTYNGFDIMFKGDTGGMGYSVILKGSNEYSVEYAGSGNNIARFSGVLNRLDAELTRVRERVETLKSDLDFAKQEVSKPFEKEKELAEALVKQKDITYRYEHYGEKTDKAENAETEENTDTVRSSRDTATESSRADRWTADRVDNGKESKSAVSVSEIIEQISTEFGIPISTGKVTDSEASGIYKDKPETIRTRIANNLPTISHELGHHLDKKYDLSKLESVKELRKVVSEEFLKQYPANAKNSEAVAEFIRIYLKNTNDANRLCPDFYSDLISTLSKEDLKALNEIASSVNEYLSYDIDKRYESSVISAKKAKKMQKLPFAERWKNLYTGWVDKFHPLKQITDYVSEIKGSVLSGIKNAYVLATNSLNAHTIANYQVLEGFRDLNGNFVDGAKSLIECIGMVNSKDITTLDLYLKLKHALEVIGKGKRVFADEVLEDTDNIKKKIAEIEKEHPEMIEAANNLYEFQYNMLKHFAVPSGIMTMEQVEYLHHEYPCYVPFYRFIKNKKGGMFAKSSFVNQGSPIMRQTGSGLDTLSHLESIIRNVEKIVKASTRNQTAAVLGSYADNVDGIGQFIEKVTPDMLPHTIDITALKENFANRLQEVVKSGDDFFAISGLMDEVFGDDVTDFTPIANESKKIISVMRGGEKSYYQIHDDALFSAVAELSPQQVNGWIKVNNMIMRPMKLLITQNNPIFAATNALRDFGTAYKLSEINNPLTFATQYVKALGGIIANSESYKQYKAMGGGHSSELSANIENISKTLRRVAQKDMGKARRLAYSIFRHPVDTVASINDAVESIPRFMEFERTLKENGDLQKAIFNASDITTNFKRSGSSNTAKFVNSSIMFNNAAIQGLDKMFRTITAKDPKKRYATLTKWLLHALIMGILGYLYNKEVDEEGYKNLSSYKKNNFYNFAIGDGKFISLPKPRENALLDTVTERTIEYLFGDNEEAFYDFGSYLGSQLLPPMLPDTLHPVDAVHSVGGSTIFGGLLDVGFNKDFKGTPIEGAYDKYTPSNERYTESTTKPAYELGQTKLARDLDMSPKKIDHLISSYTGILGQVNKALLPMNESRKDTSFGLRNKFVSDSNYSTDVLNRMYENQEKAEKAFNYSGSVDDAVEYEKNSVITSYISGMNKAVKALPEEEQRNGRAYLLKTLNSWNYENTASQSNMLSSLADSTVSKDCIFSELPSSTLEWTVDKQKYIYQMTPQEYHKYISDYLTVIENARKYYGRNTVESYEAAKTAAKEYMSDYKKNVLKEQYIGKAVPKAE